MCQESSAQKCTGERPTNRVESLPSSSELVKWSLGLLPYIEVTSEVKGGIGDQEKRLNKLWNEWSSESLRGRKLKRLPG
ncbi:hypothetical protein VULLAG_LOCUS6941 [Vulpes lagopus]